MAERLNRMILGMGPGGKVFCDKLLGPQADPPGSLDDPGADPDRYPAGHRSPVSDVLRRRT